MQHNETSKWKADKSQNENCCLSAGKNQKFGMNPACRITSEIVCQAEKKLHINWLCLQKER